MDGSKLFILYQLCEMSGITVILIRCATKFKEIFVAPHNNQLQKTFRSTKLPNKEFLFHLCPAMTGIGRFVK